MNLQRYLTELANKAALEGKDSPTGIQVLTPVMPKRRHHKKDQRIAQQKPKDRKRLKARRKLGRR